MNTVTVPRETGACIGIHELFEMQVKLNPEREAVRFIGESLSYDEVNRRSNKLAHYLISEGVEKGTLVGVYMERSASLLIALLAILKAGAAYVPLDPAHPRQRNENILSSVNMKYLISQESLKSTFSRPGLKVLTVDGLKERIGDSDSSNPEITVEKDQLAYVIFTSGSTGTPKGVQITHSNVVNILTFMKEKLEVDGNDKVLALTTVTFDISVLELFLPLVSGACTVITPGRIASDGAGLAQLIENEGITIMQATPSTFHMLLDAGWKGDPSLRILCGGEAWSVKLAEALLDRCMSLWNVYGPTETTVWSTIKQIQRGDKAITLGQPVSNTTLYIINEEGREAAVGETGELYIGGVGVGKGYLNDPALTAEKFIQKPFAGDSGGYVYRTGDVVRKLQNGDIEYIERADFQVKIRGFRIELGEIENALLKHPSVNQAVAVVKSRNEEKYICAYVSVKSGEDVEELELKDMLRNTLPSYMIPSNIYTVDKFPMTPNGKIDRKALAAEPIEHKVECRSKAEPVTDIEKKIYELWSELLEIDDFGVHDNFLELGGHSLMANRLVIRINNSFGSQVTLMELLTGGLTVHEMARTVEKNLLSNISDEDMDALLAELDDMTAEELERYLANNP